MAWVAVCVFAGAAAYVKFTPAGSIPDSERRDLGTTHRAPSSTSAAQKAAQRKPGKGEVEVLTPYYDGDDLKFEKRPVRKPAGADKYLFAVNQFLKESGISPDGAVATSAKLDGHQLALDFNSKFSRTYGTDDERTLVNGILSSLEQFQEIESVRLTIDGKVLDTLGNIDLTQPLPVDRPQE